MAPLEDPLGNVIGNYDTNPQTTSDTPLMFDTTSFYNSTKAGNFDKSKYSVDDYSYPSDLMSNTQEYGSNYVIFYINVATDSKLLKGPNAAEVVDGPIPRDRSDLIAQDMSRTGLVASNAVLNAGGAVLGKMLGAGGGASAGVAAVATVGVGAAATLAPDATRSQKRLKTAIAMHVPNQLNIRYGMQWSDEDTAGLAMANAALTQGGEVMKALAGKSKNKDVTGVAAAIMANVALSKGPNAGANSAALGLAANPKKEQVFKGVDFRTFQFEYNFFPRNSTEAKNVLAIINQFKYHMHPEFKDANNFVYIYPSEFDIAYYVGGKENPNIHRHTSCVLTDMNINYTPNGAFTTFADGMPTQINITLGFRELALLTKDKIQDGL